MRHHLSSPRGELERPQIQHNTPLTRATESFTLAPDPPACQKQQKAEKRGGRWGTQAPPSPSYSQAITGASSLLETHPSPQARGAQGLMASGETPVRECEAGETAQAMPGQPHLAKLP